MLKDRMERAMKEGMVKYGLEVQKMAYADGCLDMYNEAVREYEEIFAEQNKWYREGYGTIE